MEKMLKSLSPEQLDELMQQMSGGLDDKMKDQLKKGLNPVLNEVDSEGGVRPLPEPRTLDCC